MSAPVIFFFFPNIGESPYRGLKICPSSEDISVPLVTLETLDHPLISDLLVLKPSAVPSFSLKPELASEEIKMPGVTNLSLGYPKLINESVLISLGDDETIAAPSQAVVANDLPSLSNEVIDLPALNSEDINYPGLVSETLTHC